MSPSSPGSGDSYRTVGACPDRPHPRCSLPPASQEAAPPDKAGAMFLELSRGTSTGLSLPRVGALVTARDRGARRRCHAGSGSVLRGRHSADTGTGQAGGSQQDTRGVSDSERGCGRPCRGQETAGHTVRRHQRPHGFAPETHRRNRSADPPGDHTDVGARRCGLSTSCTPGFSWPVMCLGRESMTPTGRAVWWTRRPGCNRPCPAGDTAPRHSRKQSQRRTPVLRRLRGQ
jgi:hypothetical protein